MHYHHNIFYAIFLSLATANSVHWQWRDLICATKDGVGLDKISKEPASCSLALRETGVDNDPNDKWRPAPGNNSVCFDEIVNRTVRTYCNLLCPNADTVYLIKRTPQTHRSCFAFVTYHHEKRGTDWYIWRTENCRLSTITFTIRCEFHFDRKEFPSDEEIFKKLRKA
ncbi:hypothetical protein LOAG_05885 [Loa loa]|uniref:DUF7808 domain-containing protein n=1 Tax=Loa loa TaxID=7209 RepID=A0A1S0TZT7_LOALO|nr:hypothetical protein LOAG_05885 [Loa loa]EFO22601.1 hypothetical protein LOAG_05885 [Loa loa]